MHFFRYKYNKLYAEEIPIEEITKNIETPFYLYSYKTISHHFQKIKKAFSDYDNLICFSVKSCDHLTILKILSDIGSGFDVVSYGEIFKVLKANGNAQKIVFAGVGKKEDEIRYAIKNKIFLINIESYDEAVIIDKVAKEFNMIQDIAIRINPQVDVSTHKYDITGSKGTKFGIEIDKVLNVAEKIKKLKNVIIKGIHFHLGSQILDIQPYIDALKKVIIIFFELKNKSFDIKYLDIGGGLGIIYDREKPLTAMQFVKMIDRYLKKIQPCKIIIEPGRFIVGNSGLLVTKVLYKKKSNEKSFLIVDAAMNDLIRPSLYNSYHKILPLTKKNGKKFKFNIVGPICESGDFLGLDRNLQNCKEGDFLAIFSCGAYAATMGSNYNSRLKPTAILVKGNKYHTIREKESFEDLVRNEILLNFCK